MMVVIPALETSGGLVAETLAAVALRKASMDLVFSDF
jgi:hypothetical protein